MQRNCESGWRISDISFRARAISLSALCTRLQSGFIGPHEEAGRTLSHTDAFLRLGAHT